MGPAENRQMLPQELDRLGGTSGRLQELVTQLQDRLSPALREAQPSPSVTSEPPGMPPGSQISARVREEAALVDNQCARLQDLLHRLDL